MSGGNDDGMMMVDEDVGKGDRNWSGDNIFSEHKRSFLYSSFEAFSEYRNHLEELSKLPISRTVFVAAQQEKVLRETSGRYVSLLRDFQRKHLKYNPDDVGDYGKKTYHDICLLSLFEVMFLRKSEQYVNYLLVMWNQNLLQPTTPTSKNTFFRLTESPNSFDPSDSSSWKFIIKFGLEGRFKEVKAILQPYLARQVQNASLSPTKRKMFRILDTIFSNDFIPVCPPHFNRTNFSQNFSTWQNYFTQLLRLQRGIQPEERFSAPLLDLLKIFAGDQGTILKYCGTYDVWLSYFVSLLLFKFPLLLKSDLFRIALQSKEEFEKFAKKRQKGVFSETILAVLDVSQSHLEQILQNCTKICTNWFLTHTSDLLFHRRLVIEGVMSENQIDEITRRQQQQHKEHYHEAYLLEFVLDLVRDVKTANIGIRYLYFYSKNKSKIIGRFLAGLDYGRVCGSGNQSEEKSFHELVSIVEDSLKKEDPKWRESILRQMHREYALEAYRSKKKNIAFVIHHLFMAHDYVKIEEVSMQLLKEYHLFLVNSKITEEEEEEGEEVDVPLDTIRMVANYLRNSTREFLEVKILLFIKMYGDLLEFMLEEKNYKEAGELLVEILRLRNSDKISVPGNLLYQLIKHAIRIVDQDKTVFSASDIQKMIKVLCDITVGHDRKVVLDGVDMVEVEKIRNVLLQIFSSRICL